MVALVVLTSFCGSWQLACFVGDGAAHVTSLKLIGLAPDVQLRVAEVDWLRMSTSFLVYWICVRGILALRMQCWMHCWDYCTASTENAGSLSCEEFPHRSVYRSLAETQFGALFGLP